MKNDIFIPEFEITDGWYVSDLETADDCRDAMDVLDVAMIGIKDSIARYEAGLSPERDVEWRIRAETALKYKRMAHKRVNTKRGELTGMRHLNVAIEALNRKISHIRSVLVTASDETLRDEIAELVGRKAA